MACLVFGALLGTASALAPGRLVTVLSARAHIDLMLFGFMLQFALGTASWILPWKSAARPISTQAITFNAGLLALLVGQMSSAWQLLELGGRVTILIATLWIVATLLPRVRPVIAHSHQ